MRINMVGTSLCDDKLRNGFRGECHRTAKTGNMR